MPLLGQLVAKVGDPVSLRITKKFPGVKLPYLIHHPTSKCAMAVYRSSMFTGKACSTSSHI